MVCILWQSTKLRVDNSICRCCCIVREFTVITTMHWMLLPAACRMHIVRCEHESDRPLYLARATKSRYNLKKNTKHTIKQLSSHSVGRVVTGQCDFCSWTIYWHLKDYCHRRKIELIVRNNKKWFFYRLEIWVPRYSWVLCVCMASWFWAPIVCKSKQFVVCCFIISHIL